MDYFDILFIIVSEYTSKLITGYRRGGMLVIPGLKCPNNENIWGGVKTAKCVNADASGKQRL